MSTYSDLKLPAAPADRPYTFINMVTTIDGKSVSGTREDGVMDLGSSTDHILMRRIEGGADAIMVGAQTVRSAKPSWNPNVEKRLIVTRSGNLPLDSRFFEGEAYAISPLGTLLPQGVAAIRGGEGEIDWLEMLRKLRQELGIERLLVSGGSELNGALLHADLIDDLFWTIAPKVKLGRDLPTYAGGEPLPREALLHFDLLEHHVVENEIFLRYRRRR